MAPKKEIIKTNPNVVGTQNEILYIPQKMNLTILQMKNMASTEEVRNVNILYKFRCIFDPESFISFFLVFEIASNHACYRAHAQHMDGIMMNLKRKELFNLQFSSGFQLSVILLLRGHLVWLSKL